MKKTKTITMAAAIMFFGLGEVPRRVFRDRLNPLDCSDAMVKQRYRLPRHLILILVRDFSQSLFSVRAPRNRALNPLQMVRICTCTHFCTRPDTRPG